MNISWQDILVAGIVLAAVAYLARTVVGMLRGRQAGCGSCGSCETDPAKTSPLVSLEPPGKKSPQNGARSAGGLHQM